MKITSPIWFALLTVAFTVAAAAGAQQPTAAPHEHHEHEHPMAAPTNLQVLPKTLTGDQVHEMMHQWSAWLGTGCGTCHAADTAHPGPTGRARFNYAADSKPDKATARLMARMMEEINSQYIGKLDDAMPVTCGTCHRGHLSPPLFVPKPDHDDDHDHDEHEAPPAAAK